MAENPYVKKGRALDSQSVAILEKCYAEGETLRGAAARADCGIGTVHIYYQRFAKAGRKGKVQTKKK